MAGFVLTAVPEFTITASASPRTARQLVLLWLLGRAGFWPRRGGQPCAGAGRLAHLAWRAVRWSCQVCAAHRGWRRHHAFGWALAGLFVLVAGFM